MASAERVYEALTTQEGLAGWYTPETKTDPLFSGKAVVGSLVDFKFAELTTIRFRVAKLEPGRLVEWAGVDVPDEWKSTPITFDIIPEGDSANLKFSQTGFAPDYVPFGGFSYCWGQYVRSHKLLLGAGRGEPFGSTASKAAGTTPRRTSH